jgi:hypothetical protein
MSAAEALEVARAVGIRVELDGVSTPERRCISGPE